MQAQLVQDQAALNPLIDHWRRASVLAIDTEFVREKTYFPQLCLLQISDGSNLACIDMLAGLDVSPLLDLLESASLTSLFHAPGQDLEILVQLHNRCPTAIFDSQLAASLLGHGDQMGYAALIKLLCGVSLDKSLSRTNWARRPLHAREVAYAAADVSYLMDIYPRLRDDLSAAGRLAWHEEDCRRMARADRYRPSPETEWKRLKGLARIDSCGQHLAAKLCEWRETLAIEKNRPRRWILPDDAIYSIAERQPGTLDQLNALGALPAKLLNQHGEHLIALIAKSVALDRPPLISDQRADEKLAARIKRLLGEVRRIAAENGIPTSLLAPRSDIETLAVSGEQTDLPIMSGWRRELAGDALLSAL